MYTCENPYVSPNHGTPNYDWFCYLWAVDDCTAVITNSNSKHKSSLTSVFWVVWLLTEFSNPRYCRFVKNENEVHYLQMFNWETRTFKGSEIGLQWIQFWFVNELHWLKNIAVIEQSYLLKKLLLKHDSGLSGPVPFVKWMVWSMYSMIS